MLESYYNLLFEQNLFLINTYFTFSLSATLILNYTNILGQAFLSLITPETKEQKYEYYFCLEKLFVK